MSYTDAVICLLDNRFIDIATFVLKYKKANINPAQKNYNGNTMLLMAAIEDDIDLIATLLKLYGEKCDPYAVNFKQEKAASILIYNGNLDAIKLLVDNFNSVDLFTQFDLSMAMTRKDPDIAVYLIRIFGRNLIDISRDLNKGFISSALHGNEDLCDMIAAYEVPRHVDPLIESHADNRNFMQFIKKYYNITHDKSKNNVERVNGLIKMVSKLYWTSESEYLAQIIQELKNFHK